MKKGKNGRRREMRQLGIIRTKNNNARPNKRLQIRRLSVKNEETVMSLSMSLTSSSSSSSSSSSENYDVLEKKARGNTVTCLSHGTMSVIGRRKEMEDALRVELGFMGGGDVEGDGGDDDDDQKKYDFFGVYDGHGGARVAEACKERMHEVLAEVVAGEEYGEKNIEWERVMEGCFGKMDEEVNRGSVREEMVGSTAVVAVVGKEELVVANCGDSRAVLSRGGVVVPLSVDHKVLNYYKLKLELHTHTHLLQFIFVVVPFIRISSSWSESNFCGTE